MLPFTAEILFSSFEQYNRALWPLPIVASALGIVMLALALRPARAGDRAIGMLLALAWLWVGVGYHILHFAALDFAAPVVAGNALLGIAASIAPVGTVIRRGATVEVLATGAPLLAAPAYGAFFVVQGLLLGWRALVRNGLAFRFTGDLFGWCGLALALAAALAWPLADGLWSPGWPSVRVVGLAPGPTAVFNLGMLLLSAGRTPLHLALIPLLWTLIAGATAWILSIPQDLALPVVGIGAIVLILWKNRRYEHA